MCFNDVGEENSRSISPRKDAGPYACNLYAMRLLDIGLAISPCTRCTHSQVSVARQSQESRTPQARLGARQPAGQLRCPGEPAEGSPSSSAPRTFQPRPQSGAL